MLRHSFVAAALLVAAPFVTTVFADGVSADTPPTCQNLITGREVTATKWLDAPGTLIGTAGPDVLAGSTGSDVIKGLGGNDIICTQPAFTVGDPDVVEGGTGNDQIGGYGTLRGGAGSDIISTGTGGFADGGTGNDDLIAVQGGSASGGAGDDKVKAFDGGSADGGSGNDEVAGFNAILLGGSGNDFVSIYIPGYAATRIDCGSGRDTYAPELTTDVRRCETDVTTDLP